MGEGLGVEFDLIVVWEGQLSRGRGVGVDVVGEKSSSTKGWEEIKRRGSVWSDRGKD